LKGEKNMTRIKTAIATLLILTFVFSLFALPAALAQYRKKPYPFIGAMPNPVGRGQEVLLHFGSLDQTAWPQPGWFNITVTVEKPDGKIETLGPFTTDTTGGTGAVIVPDQVGTYYLTTNFPEQVLTTTSAGIPAGTIMEAGKSEKLALNVTQEPRTFYPDAPLPTEYWTRPVNAQFRGWNAVASNWYTTPNNRYAPYNDAPGAPHILWATPLAEGGLAGGELGVNNYEMGDAYEGKFVGQVIIDGMLFFNRQIPQNAPQATTGAVSLGINATFGNATAEQQVVALDLKTGKEVWTRVLGNNERVSFGQTMYWQTMNLYGAYSYIWTTVTVGTRTDWKAYDPLTGRWEFTIMDVPASSGTVNAGGNVYGPNGEILKYVIDTTKGWMAQWNSTQVVFNTYMQLYLNSTRLSDRDTAKYWSERWRPMGYTFNASFGYNWNITIPTGLPGNPNAYFPGDIITGGFINTTARLWDGPIYLWAINLNASRGTVGQVRYNTTWTPPSGGLTLAFGARSTDDRLITVRAKEIRAFFGFNMDTGQNLWGPTETRGYMDAFMGGPSGENGMIAYGKLYLGTVAGVLQAIDVKTGEVSWTYENKQPYTELMWGGSYWPIEFAFSSDGKVYLLHTEHSGNSPLPRGAPFVCLNATTGEIIFKVDGLFRFTVWGGDPMLADSTAIIFNTYDNRIYAVGRGPSQTTVTAPDTSVPFGSSVMIRGTVTDISAGTQESAVASRFPNGVPAVSDESMGEWMKYVYQQTQKPTNASGVEVVLSVLDSNNNIREIGRTTSDANGFYSLNWTPDISGKYNVFAAFAGSESYWPSHAETAFVVDPATEPVQTPEYPQPIDYTMSIVGVGIAILAAIAVVGLVLFRKKP